MVIYSNYAMKMARFKASGISYTEDVEPHNLQVEFYLLNLLDHHYWSHSAIYHTVMCKIQNKLWNFKSNS